MVRKDPFQTIAASGTGGVVDHVGGHEVVQDNVVGARCRRNSSSTTPRALRGPDPVIGSAPGPPGRTASYRPDAPQATGRARCGNHPGR